MANTLERQAEWRLAEQMLEVWKKSASGASGTKHQREVSRMVEVLRMIRDQS